MLDITFTHYAESDFNDLREMIFGLYEEDSYGLPMTEEKIIKTSSQSICHPEKVQIYMIRGGEASIGYGILVFSWSNEYGGDIIYIDELYIKKEYRNRKAGSRFIRYILESNKNAVQFALETTPANKDALRFYKSLGFEVSPNAYMIYGVPGGNMKG